MIDLDKFNRMFPVGTPLLYLNDSGLYLHVVVKVAAAVVRERSYVGITPAAGRSEVHTFVACKKLFAPIEDLCEVSK